MASKESGWARLGMKPNFFHMAVGLILITAILFFHFQLVRAFDLPALAAIVFFNLLFVFLIFPLEGPLLRKIVLLIAGNHVGALWYIIQASFEGTFFLLNTDLLRIVVLVVKPLIDFVWIVAVWSLSLSVLSSYRIKRERLEKG